VADARNGIAAAWGSTGATAFSSHRSPKLLPSARRVRNAARTRTGAGVGRLEFDPLGQARSADPLPHALCPDHLFQVGLVFGSSAEIYGRIIKQCCAP
jgi:hypothetical protein